MAVRIGTPPRIVSKAPRIAQAVAASSRAPQQGGSTGRVVVRTSCSELSSCESVTPQRRGAERTERLGQPDGRHGRANQPSTIRLILSTAVVYLAVSMGLHHEVLANLGDVTTGWATSDAHLFVWWLNWLPWSLLNDQDPLLTTYQNYPTGVNGMWNTTVPILAILLSPVTLTVGPVVAYNLGMILGPVVSGLALVLALGRYLTKSLPRGVAGLLYGFCPFVIAHTSAGHLNLVWDVLPPALLWAVHPLFVKQGTQPWRIGALLGLAFALQTGIYTQSVALGAIVLLVVAAVLAARWPRRVVDRLPFVIRAGTACIGVYILLCAYPIYLLLAGPSRPRATIRGSAPTGADAANILVPSHLSLLQFGTSALGEKLQSHAGEQGGYIGVALLVLILVVIKTIRRSDVRVAGIVGLILWVFSLGGHLVILGFDTGVSLPWELLKGIPLLADAEAVRLQIFVALVVAVIVAYWLEHVGGRAWHGRRRAGAVTILAATATWMPSNSQQAVQVTTPAFFANASDHLSPGAVVETFPRASPDLSSLGC